jgi:hypothetical protein
LLGLLEGLITGTNVGRNDGFRDGEIVPLETTAVAMETTIELHRTKNEKTEGFITS